MTRQNCITDQIRCIYASVIVYHVLLIHVNCKQQATATTTLTLTTRSSSKDNVNNYHQQSLSVHYCIISKAIGVELPKLKFLSTHAHSSSTAPTTHISDTRIWGQAVRITPTVRAGLAHWALCSDGMVPVAGTVNYILQLRSVKLFNLTVFNVFNF